MYETVALKNLNRLIQTAATRYSNEFVWQDIRLTDEFKVLYTEYLEKHNCTIDFFDNTAVITSASCKYIFVPNQWFVIASYCVDVCKELFRYKEYLLRVSDNLDKRADEYIKHLRDSRTIKDKENFIRSANAILAEDFSGDTLTDSVNKLWRFATDYSWWSGQKTIDRGDFFVSVILNMLNLVNTSQGYVADIVNAYVTDYRLLNTVKRIDCFTVDLEGTIIDEAYQDTTVEPESEICDVSVNSSNNVSSENGKIRIKLSDDKKKTIRFKG